MSRSSSDQIDIANVNEDADGNEYENLSDEYILLKNTGTNQIQLNDWTVSDTASHVYSFPTGVTLDPQKTIILYTGNGPESDTESYWGEDKPVWNNDGDTVIISNQAGRTVVTYSY